jgi:hypothetical protein
VTSILWAIAIFLISVVILGAFRLLAGSPTRATGHAVVNLWKITFIYVGALYLVAGFVMRFAVR